MSTSRRNCTTGLPQAATKIISFPGAPSVPRPKNNPLQQQPLSPKPNAPNHPHNTPHNPHTNNSNHKYSNTQPMMRDSVINNIFSGNPQSTPTSPSALQQRYNRSDTLSSQISNMYPPSTTKDKPLPSRPSSRPLTPITYNYDFFTANNNQNNTNKHSNNTTHRKAPPKHTKNSQSQTIRTNKVNYNISHTTDMRNRAPPPMAVTRRRHQGTVSAAPKGNWQLKYEKLKKQYDKVESEQKELKQKHGALTRQYRMLEKNYNNKCMECNSLIEEKKELNRNLTEVARRDSIAKSDKSDNISLSGDFSDNKSEYSAIGIINTNIVHQLIASPSQSALSSIPPYNPNMNGKRSHNKHHNNGKYVRKLGGKLMGPPHGIFSDDGTESETSMASSAHKYNKQHISVRNSYNNNRIMNGSISSLESENTNHQFAINGSQKFSLNTSSIKTNVNSYDDEQNLDP
eukprot:1004311_1